MTPLDKFLKRPGAPAWAFFLIAFLARLAGVLTLFGPHLYFSDETIYLRLAGEVAHGLWLGHSADAAPGPLYFWALGRLMGLGITGLRVMQALAGAGAVSVVFLIARRIFGGRVAALTGLILCFYPYLIYLPGVLYPQATDILTLALTFYFLLRHIQEGGMRWIILGGVSLGISALFVVPILSASPLLALWVVLAAPGAFRRRVGRAFVLGVVTLAVIIPWTVRNYVVLHHFVFITALGPRQFYWANNAAADPYDRDAEAWAEQNLVRLRQEMVRQAMTQDELDRHLEFRAHRFLREHPGRAFHNYLVRLGMFFDAAPRPFTRNEQTTSRRTTLLAILSSVPILVLAPLGIFTGRRRWKLWFPLAAVPLAQALSYACFHVSLRYRFPHEPYFILFAVVGVVGLLWPEWMDPADSPAPGLTTPPAARTPESAIPRSPRGSSPAAAP